MSRAKRLNAEKVTISIDSDVLLSAKHKALDDKLTLSDYIQELVRQDISQNKQKTVEPVKGRAVKPNKSEPKPVIIEPVELGSNIFEGADEPTSEPVITIASDERIMELKESGNTNKTIAEILNKNNQLTKKGLQWNDENIKSNIARIRKAVKNHDTEL